MALALSSPAHAADKSTHLPRTAQVVSGIMASFAGQPTRAQLLLGGLSALPALVPGTVVKADDADPSRVLLQSGKVKLVFTTQDMVADSEVVQAIGRAVTKLVKKVPVTDVDDAVAAGVVHALGDRHSSYLKAFFVERLGYSAGELLGDPGVELDLDPDGTDVTVRSVVPGSSAALTGIRVGQRVRRIDTFDVDGLSLGELGALLLGQSGSHVTMVLQESAKGPQKSVDVVRDPPYALQPHIRRIEDALHVVPGPLLGSAHSAIREALDQRGNALGVILDLRGNGGGQVGDAVAVADLFVGKGPLAEVVGKPQRPVQRYDAVDGDPGESVPVVVLMDGRTASASELVAMVLRERRKVPLLGSRSYGKGSVQKLLPVVGGGYLKITAGHYQTAQGTRVGDGLTANRTLDDALVCRRGQEGELSTDGWLRSALEELRTEATVNARTASSGQ